MNKSVREIEIELARATAEREKARVVLSALGGAPRERRGRRSVKTVADRRKAERRKAKTDRRKPDASLPKEMKDRRRADRRRTDAIFAARHRAFAEWLKADIAVEKALAELTRLKAGNRKP